MILSAGSRLLITKSLAESAITGFTIAVFTAIAAAFPFLIYQLWGFVVPALHARERVAGFWMLPAAVLFFYGGIAFGYVVGLPYFYSWLLSWTASDPTVQGQLLQQGAYFGFFVLMTVCFGLVMDIPWVVIVLSRLRLVPPGWFAKHRKILLMVAVVVAAVISPPDPYSQLMLIAMMVILFEVGLFVARMMYNAQDPDLLNAGKRSQSSSVTEAEDDA